MILKARSEHTLRMTTFLQYMRIQPPGTMSMMARTMLDSNGCGDADEDQRRMGLARTRPGMLRSISGLPVSLVRGTVSLVGAGRSSSSDGDSLADQWLEFLIQQAQAADASEAAQATSGQPPAAGDHSSWFCIAAMNIAAEPVNYGIPN